MSGSSRSGAGVSTLGCSPAGRCGGVIWTMGHSEREHPRKDSGLKTAVRGCTRRLPHPRGLLAVSGSAPSAPTDAARGGAAEIRTVAGLAPVLDQAAQASGLIGHNAVDPASNQGTEVTPVVNRPDNQAQTRPRRARGV